MKCPTHRCHAACCGPVPIPKELYEKHKDRVLPGCALLPCGEIVSVFHPESMICGFLGYDYKCKIYEDRPYVCRMFGSEDELRPLLRCKHLGQISAEEQEIVAEAVIKRVLDA